MSDVESILLPPWRERLPDGRLGQEYGPRSVRTYERQIARWKDWAYRRPSREARLHADDLIAFMRLEDGSLREDVPPSERDVYVLIYEQGHSIRWTARERGLSRETVRSYIRRLKAKVPRE
jgi:DNA-directed RNA polymerase specialized sigma24 family protein